MHNTPSSSTWMRPQGLRVEEKKTNAAPAPAVAEHIPSVARLEGSRLTNSSGTPSTPALISSTYDPQRDANRPDARVNISHMSGVASHTLPRSAAGPSVWNVVADSPFNASTLLGKTSPQPPTYIRSAEASAEGGSPNANWERGQTENRTSASAGSAPVSGVPPGTSQTQDGCGAGSDVIIAYGAATGTRKAQDSAQQRHEKLLLQQRNVYVSGLPPEFKAHELQALCEAFGPVVSVKLCMIDSASLPRETAVASHGGASSGRHTAEVDPALAGHKSASTTHRHEIIPACKGYGFVLFRDYESATACIVALNNKVLKGKPLQVRRADLTAAPPRKTTSTAVMPPMSERFSVSSGSGGSAVMDPAHSAVAWPSVGGVSPPQFITQDASSSALPRYAFGGFAPGTGGLFTQTSPTVTAAPVQPSPVQMVAATPPLYFNLPPQASAPVPSTASQSYLYSPMQFSALPSGQPQNFAAPVMTANPTGGEYRMMYVPSLQSMPPHVSASLPPMEQAQPGFTGPTSQLGGTPQVMYYFLAPNGQTYAVSGG